jgi:hypothetical protein
MRDQYVGDISDLLKVAFLRSIAGTDRTLGVAWYFIPGDDGRSDGQHREWHEEQSWLTLDPDLHPALSSLSERSVAALQSADIWPAGTVFHPDPMPAPLLREPWGEGKRSALDSADLVFLDPDNGIGKPSIKHATLSEVNLLRRAGRAITFITFPGRSRPHDILVKELHRRIREENGAASVITLRTCVSVRSVKRPNSFLPRLRWFTIVDPDAALVARTERYARVLSNIPRATAKLCLD